MAQGRKIRLVINPRSGSKEHSPEALRASFAGHGCECAVTLLDRRVDLAGLHTTDDADTVWVAAGGDGTVNCVAHAVAGSGRSMGVLPVGTLNHFAQDLGIPIDVEAALELAATGQPRPVDAAEVNGRTFVNNSSLGLYPAMVVDRDRMCRRGAAKWWSMAVAATRAFLRFRRLHILLQVNGETRECTTALLFVGNNIYALDGQEAGKRKQLNQALLSLYFVPNPSRMCMLRLASAALAGRPRTPGDLDMFHVEHIEVQSRRRLKVALDGEVHRLQPPLVYKSLPAALLVIAPPPASQSPGSAASPGPQ